MFSILAYVSVCSQSPSQRDRKSFDRKIKEVRNYSFELKRASNIILIYYCTQK
jgi:hypothetical protein